MIKKSSINLFVLEMTNNNIDFNEFSRSEK
jgi:hypothetical protein